MTTTTARSADPSVHGLAESRTMQAVVRERYGSADGLQLRQIGMPTLRADQVLVRVHAAGLDRGAWHLMTGRPYLMRLVFGLRAPRNVTLGSDVAGVVEAVGAQVTGFRPGERVFGTCFGTSSGSFAEYALARWDRLAHLPSSIPFEQAAVVPVSAQTALQALRDHGRLQSGQRVLIIGASGGVGTFAVQLARAFGACVTGVCSAAKVDLVRSLGADDVIDYTTTDLAQTGGNFDLILDIGGNRPLAQLRRRLTKTGTLVLVGAETGDGWNSGLGRQLRAMLISRVVPQRLVPFITRENSADLSTLAGMVEAGTLTPVIDRRYPLSGVADAMRDLEAGRVGGKVAITVLP